MRRFLIALVVLAVVALSVGVGWWRFAPEEQAQAEPEGVATLEELEALPIAGEEDVPEAPAGFRLGMDWATTAVEKLERVAFTRRDGRQPAAVARDLRRTTESDDVEKVLDDEPGPDVPEEGATHFWAVYEDPADPILEERVLGREWRLEQLEDGKVLQIELEKVVGYRTAKGIVVVGKTVGFHLDRAKESGSFGAGYVYVGTDACPFYADGVVRPEAERIETDAARIALELEKLSEEREREREKEVASCLGRAS